MIKLKNNKNNYGIYASLIGMGLNILLFISKFFIGLITNSVAIMADGFNNLFDVSSAIINVVGYKLAQQPADEEHPFGHGRIEYLTSLIIAFIIGYVGIQLLISSIQKIFVPETLNYSTISLVVMLLSILIKLFMGIGYRYVFKITESPVMLASSKDSFSDVIATSSATISLLLFYYFGLKIDGYIGVIVAVIILKTAYSIASDTITILIGKTPSNKLVNDIEQKAKKYPLILGIHDLIIHNYGPNNMIASLHVEMDNKNSLETTHQIIDELENEIAKDLNVQITIHVDPIDSKVSETRKIIENMILDYNEKYKINDFRINESTKQINFELTVDRNEKKDFNLIGDQLLLLIKPEYEEYKIKILIKKDFI